MKERAHWHKILSNSFHDLLQRSKVSHSHGEITVYPYLKILPASEYVDLMLSGIDMIVIDTTLQHLNSSIVCIRLGQLVEQACILYRKEKIGILNQLENLYKIYGSLFNQSQMAFPHFRHMWLYANQALIGQGPSLHQNWSSWPIATQIQVGRALYNLIYESLKFDINGPQRIRHEILFNGRYDAIPRQDAPILFEVVTERSYHMINAIKVHPVLVKWFRDADYPPLSFHPCELPMLCPPIPWTNLDDAGYLLSRNHATRLIRSHNLTVSHSNLLGDLNFNYKSIVGILDALNCLAACPWRVNNEILDYLIQIARSGGDEKLSISEWKNKTFPKFPIIAKETTNNERRIIYKKYNEEIREYDKCRSLWSNELYRLSIANHYRNQTIWFPHSMDFRGRIYPCPPHFNHMGSDVARGLIKFAKGLPLGADGLNWLKIHLVNLTGLKKRSPNSERLEFANSLLDEILDSAENPFKGRGWWREQEEPWQTLACCIELRNALKHPSGPESFISHFPIHQDGSCNGLQHYAALGRDQRGAESVNLTPLDRPQDVYSDVVEVVEAQRRADAASGMPVAQALEGFVIRKVIKQSVMTTVYGVTHYGATQQIERQLRDLHDFPKDPWLRPASRYLAQLTLNSIVKIFTSSGNIQKWFGQIARHISSDMDSCVSWITPLGLPVIQPYLTNSKVTENDSLDNSKSHSTASTSSIFKSLNEIPHPNPTKQSNAFPPNFIHSLDSTHMMLTALHCLKAGIMFASVHDCFWTHAATVDQLNRICREEFVALHTQPLLENLADYLRNKFAYSESELSEMADENERAKAKAFNNLLNNVPEQGDYNLHDVIRSTYFFS